MTNLFRDQLDRYGEIDITMNILEEMIRKVPDMKLIVNGDDALSAYLAKDSGNACIYYGISRPVMKNEKNFRMLQPFETLNPSNKQKNKNRMLNK